MFSSTLAVKRLRDMSGSKKLRTVSKRGDNGVGETAAVNSLPEVQLRLFSARRVNGVLLSSSNNPESPLYVGFVIRFHQNPRGDHTRGHK